MKKAEWSEERGKWVLEVSSESGVHIDEADFLLTATGHFSDPKLPNYPGINDYQGHLRHSSNYDPKFDPKGKTVAVIGYVFHAELSHDRDTDYVPEMALQAFKSFHSSKRLPLEFTIMLATKPG